MKHFYKLVLVAGMLITGSINTLVKKAQNDSVAKGLPHYDAHKFSHPWFQTAGERSSAFVHPMWFQHVLLLIARFAYSECSSFSLIFLPQSCSPVKFYASSPSGSPFLRKVAEAQTRRNNLCPPLGASTDSNLSCFLLSLICVDKSSIVSQANAPSLTRHSLGYAAFSLSPYVLSASASSSSSLFFLSFSLFSPLLKRLTLSLRFATAGTIPLPHPRVL